MAEDDDQRFVHVLREANEIAWLATLGQGPGAVSDSSLLDALYERCWSYFALMAQSALRDTPNDHVLSPLPLTDQERVDDKILEGIKFRISFCDDDTDLMAVQMRRQFIAWAANPALVSRLFTLDVDDDGCVWLRPLAQEDVPSADASGWHRASIGQFCPST